MAIARFSELSIEQGFPKYRSLLAGNAAYSPIAFESIETVSISSNTLTVTFTSIPQTYKHLQIRISSRCTRAAETANLNINFGNDYNNRYYNSEIIADGTTASSSSSTLGSTMNIGRSPGTLTNSSLFIPNIIDIYDYTNTNNKKSARGMFGYDSNTVGNISVRYGLYNQVGAITRIDLTSASSSSFVSGSVFALYGIKGT